MTPTLEERLCAAAYTILTDDNRHSRDALRWATRTLRRAAHGRRTEFQSSLPALHFRENDFRAMRELRELREIARIEATQQQEVH